MAIPHTDLCKLSATQAAELIRTNQLSAQDYAKALLERVRERDPQVRAWVFLDEDVIMKQARRLDELPMGKRGPLHGVPVGIKDIFLTRDMPTKYYSRLHAQDQNAAADSACVSVLRAAGAIIFGKTATTEFATMTEGGPCTNPHNCKHTPGGSSSGSAAAVADFQVPLSIGTQTGGSIVRPGSFNGVYGFKATWGTISTEGVGRCSVSADTPGFYARNVDDLEFVAHLFRLGSLPAEPVQKLSLIGARIAFVKTHIWPNAGAGTLAAWNRAYGLLAESRADVESLELPKRFASCSRWREIVVSEEARAAFLPKYCEDKTKVHAEVVSLVESTNLPSRKKLLEAYDGLARLRAEWDRIASQFDIIITPSAIDEAPEGIANTGTAVFCSMWTILHAPAMNVPGFFGKCGLPIGLQIVGARYTDVQVLQNGKIVGQLFNRL
ncbi:glutamyl-tRNA(Gln) amidotransferase subunit A [Metarhizium rileyi]|uniref:Glutamyl-tRNA(Gln) amidotransferase subunit A n=1 Tax=Metarhizium rileyi (strain RCEF 4871) TaxID=1649241 RepID=A0A162M0Y3_METRR|nr:glutamyl-tRNA(Gln) amidotransferase subunit A [Metarhizium rileyi RCEF 4871]